MPYVTGHTKREGCVFCRMVEQGVQRDPQNYILHRGRRAFSVLNLYPYNNGHLMVVPYDHLASLELLPPETQADMMHLVCYSLEVVRRAMSPAGFNVGVNLGRAAGAGIDDHVHIHVVPRWHGDTNFMPVIAETRVIPELLDDTYKNLMAVVEQYPPPC